MQIRRTPWNLSDNMLCKNIARAKMFVMPDRLPPTAPACKFHFLQTYARLWSGWDVHVPMKWYFLSDGRVEEDKLVLVMTDKSSSCSRCTDSDDSFST